MIKILIVSAGIALGGCAPQVISSDNANDLVVIKARNSDRADAQDLADQQCQKRGLRVARAVRRLADNELGFECLR